MRKEMVDAVVHKMLLDLDRVHEDMNTSEKVHVRKAITELVKLRGLLAVDLANEEAA